MARSSAIYVICEASNEPHPVATFTVKHEAFTWARQHDRMNDRYELRRYGDGVHQAPLDWTVIEWPEVDS